MKGQGKLYVCMASGLWKRRYALHKGSFSNISRRTETELAKYVWSLKDNNINFRVFFSKLDHARPYSKESKKCSLCSIEKLNIMQHMKDEPARLLNKREEFMNKCPHRRKFLLGMVSNASAPENYEVQQNLNTHSFTGKFPDIFYRTQYG